MLRPSATHPRPAATDEQGGPTADPPLACWLHLLEAAHVRAHAAVLAAPAALLDVFTVRGLDWEGLGQGG